MVTKSHDTIKLCQLYGLGEPNQTKNLQINAKFAD